MTEKGQCHNRGDGHVSQPDGGKYITEYMCIKLSCFTPKPYTVLYRLYLSNAKENNAIINYVSPFLHNNSYT